jgi:type II secretory ATPase GspE/PulE/Tfp pilus assembly ATPase PilB-like protein
MLTVDEEIRGMITRHEPSNQIKQYAQRQRGMTTMLQDGREKVLQGLTTVQEVLRVCQREEFSI